MSWTSRKFWYVHSPDKSCLIFPKPILIRSPHFTFILIEMYIFLVYYGISTLQCSKSLHPVSVNLLCQTLKTREVKFHQINTASNISLELQTESLKVFAFTARATTMLLCSHSPNDTPPPPPPPPPLNLRGTYP